MELNPHHPTTKSVHDHWYKLAALLMSKFDTAHVVISFDDIKKIEGKSITLQELKDGIHLRLVSQEEANRLAKIHGGVSNS